MVSTQILMPSSACLSLGTPDMRLIISSGTLMPGTLFFMYLAMPADLKGVTPARMLTFS